MIDYDIFFIPEIEMNINNPSIDDCIDYCENNITYIADPFLTENWQTPSETFNLKTGDCEDGALALMALIWKYYPNKNLCMIAYECENMTLHAMVFDKDLNLCYDVTSGKTHIKNDIQYPIIAIFDRDQINSSINCYRSF